MGLPNLHYGPNTFGALGALGALNLARATVQNREYSARLGWNVLSPNLQSMPTDPGAPELAQYVYNMQGNLRLAQDGALGPMTMARFAVEMVQDSVWGRSIALVLVLPPAAFGGDWCNWARNMNRRYAAELGWGVQPGASRAEASKDLSAVDTCDLAKWISERQADIWLPGVPYNTPELSAANARAGNPVDGALGPNTLQAFVAEVRRGSALGRRIAAVIRLPEAAPAPPPTPAPTPHVGPVDWGGFVGPLVDPNLAPTPAPKPWPTPPPPPPPRPEPGPTPGPTPHVRPYRFDIDPLVDPNLAPTPAPAPPSSGGSKLPWLLALAAAVAVAGKMRQKRRRRRRGDAIPTTAVVVARK